MEDSFKELVGINKKLAHVWLVPRLKNDGHGDAIDLKNVKKLV